MIDQYGQQVLKGMGIDVADGDVCRLSDTIDLRKFYDIIAHSGGDVDSIMAIAEEELSGYSASKIGYNIPELNIYDILRYRLLLGNSSEYLVLNGSLSGIQRFIFDVKSSSARKQLTGRSYYLSLLIDAVVERILREFDLSRQAVLYSTGGTFCMLLPNERDTEQKLAELISIIKSQVYKAYNEQFVLLNYVVATRQEIESDPSAIFSKLQQMKNKAKYSPIFSEMQTDYDQIFIPFGVYESTISSKMAELGAALGKTECIVVSTGPDRANKAIISIEPGGLGVRYSLYTNDTVEYSKFDEDSAPTLITYNEKPAQKVKMPYRLEYLAGFGKYALSFEDLLKNTGESRLGVLRMDVDNLGKTLRDSYKSALPLAGFANKSRQLDRFFKRELHKIWLDAYRNSIIIVYSGGDDLFIVGSWSSTFDIARQINRQFNQTFGGHLSVSAGISLIERKFPIIRAAEYGAEEESVAKHFSYRDKNGLLHSKGSLAIFNIALRWDVELEIIREIMEKWQSLIKQDETIFKPLMRRVLSYNEIVEYNGRELSPVRQIWLMSYDIARLLNRYQKKLTQDGKEFIEKCKTDIVTGTTMQGKAIDSPYHSLQLWAIAARLVEMKIKNN